MKSWLEEEISPIAKPEIRKILGIAKHLARNLYSRQDWILSGRISPTERKELDDSLRRFQSPAGFYELTQPRL